MSKNIKISNIDNNKLLNGEMNSDGIKIGDAFTEFSENKYDCVCAILDVDETNTAIKPPSKPDDWTQDSWDDWEETLPLNVYVWKDGVKTKIDRLILPAIGSDYQDRLIDTIFPFNDIKQVVIKNFNNVDKEEVSANNFHDILDTVYDSYYTDVTSDLVNDDIYNPNLGLDSALTIPRTKLMVKIPRFYLRISFYSTQDNLFKRKYEIISPDVYNNLQFYEKEGFFVPRSFKDKKYLYVSAIPENALLNHCLFGSYSNYINPDYLPLSAEDKQIIVNQSSSLPESIAETLYVNDGWVMDVETWFGVVLILFKLYTGYINPKNILNSFQTYSSLDRTANNMFVSYYDNVNFLNSSPTIIDTETGDLQLDWEKFIFTNGIIYSDAIGCYTEYSVDSDGQWLWIYIPASYNNHILTNLFIRSETHIMTQQNLYVKIHNEINDPFVPKIFECKLFSYVSGTLNKYTKDAIFYRDSARSNDTYNCYAIRINGILPLWVDSMNGEVSFELRPIASTYTSGGETLQINEDFVKRFFTGKTIQLELGREDFYSNFEDTEDSFDCGVTSHYIITALLGNSLSSNINNYHVIDLLSGKTKTDLNSFLLDYSKKNEYGIDYSAFFNMRIFTSSLNDLSGNIRLSYDSFFDYTKKNYQNYGHFSLLYFKNIFNLIQDDIRIDELVYKTSQDIYYGVDQAIDGAAETVEHTYSSGGNTYSFIHYDTKKITNYQKFQKGVFLSNFNMGKFSTTNPSFGQVTNNDGYYINICVNDRAVGTNVTATDLIASGSFLAEGFSIKRFVCDNTANLISNQYSDGYHYSNENYYFEFPNNIFGEEEHLSENIGSLIFANPLRTYSFSEYSNNGSICSVGSLQQYYTLNHDLMYEDEPIPNDVPSINLYSINVTVDNHFENYPSATYKSELFKIQDDQYIDATYLRYKEFWFDQNILLCFSGD